MSKHTIVRSLSDDVVRTVHGAGTAPGLNTARRHAFGTGRDDLLADGLPGLTAHQISSLRDTLGIEIARLRQLSGHLGSVLASRRDQPTRIARSA